jgi:uncharacterized membrane protein
MKSTLSECTTREQDCHHPTSSQLGRLDGLAVLSSNANSHKRSDKLNGSGRFRVDSQLLINVISRVVHVSTAIALIGGSVFMVFVLLPAAKQLSDEQHGRLRELVNKTWKRFIHVGILLFLVTGFYNYFQQMPSHKGDGLYHALVGTKIILALVVFFIASVLVGRSAAFEWMRAGREKWLKVIVLLAAIIVTMSSFVKVRGPKGKAVDAQTAGEAMAPGEATDAR